MNIYAVKDEIIGFTGSIMVLRNDEEAKRMMDSTIRSGDSMFNQYPKDFSIWKLGNLDRITGMIEPESTPQYICRASDFIQKEASE